MHQYRLVKEVGSRQTPEVEELQRVVEESKLSLKPAEESGEPLRRQKFEVQYKKQPKLGERMERMEKEQSVVVEQMTAKIDKLEKENRIVSNQLADALASIKIEPASDTGSPKSSSKPTRLHSVTSRSRSGTYDDLDNNSTGSAGSNPPPLVRQSTIRESALLGSPKIIPDNSGYRNANASPNRVNPIKRQGSMKKLKC